MKCSICGNDGLQVYVTKTGKVRISDKHGEWNPPNAQADRAPVEALVGGSLVPGMTCDRCRHLAPSGGCGTFPRPGRPCNEFSTANAPLHLPTEAQRKEVR